MKSFLLLLLLCIFCSTDVQAGIFELSAVYNYKRTTYDPTTYEESESGTGSIAYYFWGMSGLELSITRGASRLNQPHYEIYQDLTAYGANLLFTIANRDSFLKPYIKAGAVMVKKNIRYIYKSVGTPPPTTAEGVQPNVGMGFKLAIGPQFEFKTGIDVSTSPLPTGTSVTNPSYDFTFNAGIGFLF